MTIRPEDVDRIAELARLEIPAERRARMAEELSAILDYVAALDRLDLADCEPSVFAPAEAPLREDATDGRRLPPDRALAGAPETEAGFFLVPPVVENLAP